ncbi:hypothetical protein GCM10010149_23780 [Nonomuraea roseoviolacea subsp. roseoviolacea]|uniref:Transcriptional regulator WhiB n=1 Tax=Nonomuraea roseoviolacea subsp. carminata TaxID=160689 RepID=A0ABT1JSX0_9ACTN|nr:WhiB family transcriptional regulator [Nonomuraea roseoviolacea]MCP2344532.1 hypothetical protein [Nonomuraea roseoviolacea subsp. carminata]
MRVRGRGAVRVLRAALVQAGPVCTSGDAELFTGPDAFTDEPADVREEREARAKAVCASCPARVPCLLYAMAIKPRVGVWAGLTSDELRGVDARAEVA